LQLVFSFTISAISGSWSGRWHSIEWKWFFVLSIWVKKLFIAKNLNVYFNILAFPYNLQMFLATSAHDVNVSQILQSRKKDVRVEVNHRKVKCGGSG